MSLWSCEEFPKTALYIQVFYAVVLKLGLGCHPKTNKTNLWGREMSDGVGNKNVEIWNVWAAV